MLRIIFLTHAIILNSDIFSWFTMCSMLTLYVACQYCVCVCVCNAHLCVRMCACVRELMWFLNDNCTHTWLLKSHWRVWLYVQVIELHQSCVTYSLSAIAELTLCTVIMVFIICFHEQNVITQKGMSKIFLHSREDSQTFSHNMKISKNKQWKEPFKFMAWNVQLPKPTIV